MNNINLIQKKNWTNITVKDYDSISEILKSDESDLSKQINLLALIYNVEPSVFWNLNINDLSTYTPSLNFLNSFKFVPFTNINTIKISGKEYRVSDISEITTAQYFDFINISKSGTDDVQQLISLLSVILVPKGKVYNEGYDISKLKEDIYNSLNFSTAQSLLGFALAKYVKSIMPSPKYLARITKKMTKEQKGLVISKIDRILNSLETVQSLSAGC